MKLPMSCVAISLELPAGGVEVVDKLFKNQRAATCSVDYVYDIPFELAKLMVSYRHDQTGLYPLPKQGFELFEVER